MIFILSTIFMAVTGIGQALATNYSTFVIFAYLNAVGTSGVFPLAFIIGSYFVNLDSYFIFCLLCFTLLNLLSKSITSRHDILHIKRC